MAVPNPDLSVGGVVRTFIRQYMGPSVGWVELPAQNVLPITAGGTYVLSPDVTLVTVNTTGSVTIKLPSAIQPTVPAGVLPGLFGSIPITIVDIGGNATAHPITIQPASVSENIMGLTSISLSVNYGGYTFAPTAGSWNSISP